MISAGWTASSSRSIGSRRIARPPPMALEGSLSVYPRVLVPNPKVPLGPRGLLKLPQFGPSKPPLFGLLKLPQFGPSKPPLFGLLKGTLPLRVGGGWSAAASEGRGGGGEGGRGCGAAGRGDGAGLFILWNSTGVNVVLELFNIYTTVDISEMGVPMYVPLHIFTSCNLFGISLSPIDTTPILFPRSLCCLCLPAGLDPPSPFPGRLAGQRKYNHQWWNLRVSRDWFGGATMAVGALLSILLTHLAEMGRFNWNETFKMFYVMHITTVSDEVLVIFAFLVWETAARMELPQLPVIFHRSETGDCSFCRWLGTDWCSTMQTHKRMQKQIIWCFIGLGLGVVGLVPSRLLG